MKSFKNIIAVLKLKYIFVALVIVICCMSINLIDRTFWNNLVESVRTTLESTKPTEELFDDTGGVKLISVLFKEDSCLVSTTPIDYDLQISNFDNFVNEQGCITIIGASGILYAPYQGEIKIDNLVDNITQITIIHSNNLSTVFSGEFGLGIKDGQKVQKGQPLAIMLSDMQFYIIQGDEILNNYDSSGEEL